VLEGFLTVLPGRSVKITGIGENEDNRAKADEVYILAETTVKNKWSVCFLSRKTESIRLCWFMCRKTAYS
jgi:hypothetical protein